MPTLNLGRVRFNWRGPYDSTVAYLKYDVVEFDGQSYVCKADVTGTNPQSIEGPIYWDGALVRSSDYNAARDQAINAASQAQTAQTGAETALSSAQGVLTDTQGVHDATVSDANTILASTITEADRATTEANRAVTEADRAEAGAASVSIPLATGNGSKILRQKADESGFEYIPEPYTRAESAEVFAPITRSRKNLLINGCFRVWQRGTSFSLASSQYTADRWFTVENRSVERIVSNIAGVGYAAKVTGLNGFEPQVYSNVELLQPGMMYPFKPNTEYTLSFKVIAPEGLPLQARVTYSDLAGGTNAVTVLPLTEVSVGTGAEQTVAIAFNTALIAPNANNTMLEVLVRGATGGSSFELAQVQLEEGVIATDFEYRLIGEELALCQRYFTLLPGPYWLHPIAEGSTHRRVNLVLPVQMRRSPSCVIGSSPSELGAPPTMQYSSPGHISIQGTVGAVTQYVNLQNITVDAEL